ncbi:MAG TPA: helix-turn-helix domain-containing protein [Bryobacteraceae bacterium]|jgi:AraC-like DNA-binding protein|nr:helix-turn-helix domain-containing protein [Bryobacteraceae bacterium]
MASYHRFPAPPLSEFVELLWLYEGYRQPHQKERMLPDGSMELVINLNEDLVRVYDPHDTGKFRTLRGSVVVGAHSEFFVIDTAEQHSVAGVHFKPGGAFPFLGLPAGELHNTLVSLEDLWGRVADQLRARLLEAVSPQARLGVLEEALLAQAGRRLERHPAVAFALHEFHGLQTTRTVAEVTGQIGLSAKRFIQVFSGEVGLTPKLFCRVRRFQRVLRRIGMARPVEWAAVATDCGYFDQAHFIHDFRAFSGINPSTYIAHCTEHFNHVPLID